MQYHTKKVNFKKGWWGNSKYFLKILTIFFMKKYKPRLFLGFFKTYKVAELRCIALNFVNKSQNI